jgi:hypothetical protein
MTKKVEIEELKREENKKRKLLSDSEWSSQQPAIASTPRETTAELKSIEVNENEMYSDLPGRRSFGGFNPSVERIYGSHLDDSQSKATREKEIVANFDKLVSLPRGPNQVCYPTTNSLVDLIVSCDQGSHAIIRRRSKEESEKRK